MVTSLFSKVETVKVGVADGCEQNEKPEVSLLIAPNENNVAVVVVVEAEPKGASAIVPCVGAPKPNIGGDAVAVDLVGLKSVRFGLPSGEHPNLLPKFGDSACAPCGLSLVFLFA
ncbi:unnamed protein product [Rotaria magnacalcarata]|uniref:Uncharacterized protein n=1 Tax=Rotaria magnacalcarata TaxID=392030 RepID=A0A817A1W6_9BILA|nr:unnamed protein product [Rotaria magnacalcarata]